MSSPPEVGGVYTGLMKIDSDNGRVLEVELAEKKGDLYNEFLDHVSLTTSTVMVRKSCINQIGLFDENIPYCSDFEMWVRIASKFQFECIEDPLAKYHIHQKKLSTNFDLVIKGREILLEKYEQWFKMNPKSYSKKYLEIGILYCLNGKLQNGKSGLFKIHHIVSV